MGTVRERLITENRTFVDGVSSLYVYNERVKYVNIEDCDPWPNLDGYFVPMLPGERARTELERSFGKPKIPVQKREYEFLKVPPPNYYDGEIRKGKLYYCDLSGAYNQIYEFLTLDCAFPCGEGELSLQGVAQRMRNDKLGRNSVIGISRSHTLELFKDGDTNEQHFANPFFNPNLWISIQAILHQLASVAISEGSFYVATDGYLFQDKEGFEAFTQFLSECGLKYKTHWGDGYCTGWCSYSVPGKKTKIYRENTGVLNNLIVEEGHIEWWRKVREYRK